jgi:hypothetical protein
MKKIFLITIVLFVTMVNWPATVNATCSLGTVYAWTSYIVNDPNAQLGDYYKVYYIVTDDCPGSSGQILKTTLSTSDLGNTKYLSGDPASLYLPNEYQSAYYFKIHIYVEKYHSNGTYVGYSTRYSYADRDYSTNDLTARTQPITVPF